MSEHFDVVVLGAGPGGYVAAVRAAELGQRVAVIEGRWWGGVCLNVGCIPTKALLHHAAVADTVLHHAEEYGIGGAPQVAYGPAYRHSRDTVERLTNGVHFLMRSHGITEIDGWGSFIDGHKLLVTSPGAADRTITCDSCIIAVGATAKKLPGTVGSNASTTYQELIMAERLPQSVVIAGSGALGLEFASLLRSYGVQVSIVEYLERLAPAEEREVSDELTKAFRKRGVEVLTGTKVVSATDVFGGVEVKVEPVGGGEGRALQAALLLQAIGVEPRVTGYGLERAGVELDEHGAIAIDEQMRTNVPGVYAIGDVTGKLMLAHTASAQGRVAAEAIAGLNPAPLDYRMIPRAMYCQPQTASFGYTEIQAVSAGYDVAVGKFSFSANGKAVGSGESVGFVKVIADAATHELLGAHILGADAAELIPELVLAQRYQLRVEEIAATIHAHPTLSEAIFDACAAVGR
ncbi:MAG: dihydrolipoyl dehydrogenase [Propionibacteriaceae bacterium]|jgi:dihydrolipoamide dehydrogenase|nr:dihydrolipoyl dehydrogenase [Propionibacteriaceae bacterium]